MEGYGFVIENVIKNYLIKISEELKVKKEQLRVVINPVGENLKIDLFNKGTKVREITIDEIISQ